MLQRVKRKQKQYNSLHFFMCKAEEYFYRTYLRPDSATSVLNFIEEMHILIIANFTEGKKRIKAKILISHPLWNQVKTFRN